MTPFEQPAGARYGSHFDGCSDTCSLDHTRANDQFGNDLSVSIREIFYAYGTRDTSDNRSAQRHLGPSEIGTPCDRRIALSLSGQRPVNPGGDGYAAWLGTQGHRGMADIYEWADGRSGRYAVETPLNFPSKLVPRGTGDLLDRKLRCFVDWKFMGTWSLKHLREKGPSDTYRVQIHTYAYGATQRGEKVDRVAIVGMPRQGATLDDMFVWSQPYDKSVAESALKRVAEIGKQMDGGGTPGDFDTADDCRYCPFHLAKSKDLSHACCGNKQ